MFGAGLVKTTRQQSFAHGAVAYDADLLLATVRQDLLFDIRCDHAVRRLQRCHLVDWLQPFQLVNVMVGYTNVANFPLSLQVAHGLPRFFDIGIGFRPVHLIQVDGFDVQATQARLAFCNDAFPFDDGRDGTVVLNDAAEFGGDDRLVA